MNAFGRRLFALTRKEFRQLLRDPSNLAIGILLPIVLILIFGYGLSLDVKNARVAVVLEDTSPTASDAISGLYGSTVLVPVPLASMHDAEQLLRRHDVKAIVRVPHSFSRALAEGDARIQLLLHGAEASTATIIRNYVEAALMQPALRGIDRQGGQAVGAAGIVIEQRLWYNSANTSTWYLVPGLIVLIITLVGAFLTALVMAREWERGTLEALFVTPVRPVEILLAKIIPYFAVGMLGLLLCLIAARFLFKVPMVGSMAVLVICAMLYLLVAVGMGLLISSVTRNQFLASQIALVTSFMPSLMLSGFLFDLRNVPVVVRAIGQILPATHFMNLIRTLFLAGDVWPLVLQDGAVLMLYAVVFLALARLVTRKKLD